MKSLRAHLGLKPHEQLSGEDDSVDPTATAVEFVAGILAYLGFELDARLVSVAKRRLFALGRKNLNGIGTWILL